MPRYAAIDVGSNSIRLLVAAVDSKGRFETLASDRQVVRLGTGVFRDGRLSDTSMDLACRVLERMTRSTGPQGETVRAVGTSARETLQPGEFVRAPRHHADAARDQRPGRSPPGARGCRPVAHLRKPVLIVDIGAAAPIGSSRDGRWSRLLESLGAVSMNECIGGPPTQGVARLQTTYATMAGPQARFSQVAGAPMIATVHRAAVCALTNQALRATGRHLAARQAGAGSVQS